MGIVDGDNQEHLIYVCCYDMTLFGKIGSLTDNVVLTIENLRYECILLSSLNINHNPVTHSYRIGTADTLQSEITFDFAVDSLPVIRKDGVPRPCILNDQPLHTFQSPPNKGDLEGLLHGHNFLILGSQKVVYLLDILVVNLLQVKFSVLLVIF